MRKKPYTQIGIRRLKCEVAGCHNKAEYQWQCCATGNLWTRLCVDHDIALNDMALKFVGHPDREKLITEYAKMARS